MTKIVILIPVWGRPNIFDLCARSVRRAIDLTTWLDIEVMAVISPEDKHVNRLKSIASKQGFDICLYKNKALGEKINAGISALEPGYDYLMGLGSDNLISPKLFDLYRGLIRKKHPLFGVGDYLIYDQETGRGIDFSLYRTITGAGRMIHRELLESMGGTLYSDRCVRGLDGNSMSRIVNRTRMTPRRLATKQTLIVDIKSDTNINAFNFVAGFHNCIKKVYERYDHKDWRGFL